MSLSNNAIATQTNYIRGVRHLMITLNKLPEDCTVHEVKAFLVKLRDTGQLSSSSLNLRVSGLKYYFRHVAKRIDLVVGIPNPRIAKYDTEVLNSQELTRLFDACRDVRQLLIVQLLFDTGIRSGELLRIQLKDFDKENRTIILRKTKGQLLRVVPYGEHLRIVLKDYIKMLGYFPKGALLESYKEKGKSLSLRGLQHIVRQLAKRSGINKRISCHTLRHSYAVHFLNNGGHLPQLQRLLGHQHITTTLHYLKYAHIPLHVPSGGLDKEGNWQNPKKGGSDFLYPILAMNKVYQAYFLRKLKIALEGGLLSLPADFPMAKPYKEWKETLYKKEWVVYTKPPFSKTKNVVNYLARYSHRIAISNHRIISVTDKEVTFRYKDYKDKAKQKVMTLKGKDFLRRFCLHIVPDRFRKIRHFGFLSNAVKTKCLTLAKRSLQNKQHQALTKAERKAYALLRLFGQPKNQCPCCSKGKLITIDIWIANKDPPGYLKRENRNNH